MALPLLLILSSFACQAEALTRLFIVESGQKAGFLKQSCFIKRDQHLCSDIADTRDYAVLDSPPDDKPLWPGGYRVKTALIESISWQWLYVTDLLVAYELILTTKNAPICVNPYSWLSLEVVVAVVWLSTSYWNLCTPLFSAIEQQTTSQDNSFAITTMMVGSEQTPQQGQPSKARSQHALKANIHPAGSRSSHLNTECGDGNRCPKKQLHTLGLNCFVDYCCGVCQWRQSSDSSGVDGWSLNLEESFTNQTEATSGQSPCPHMAFGYCLLCVGDLDPENAKHSRHKPLFERWVDFSRIPLRCDFGQPPQSLCEKFGSPMTLNHRETEQTVTDLSQLCQTQPQLSQSGTPQFTDYRGQKTCHVKVIAENGQKRSCGAMFRHTKALSDHKSLCHSWRQICNVTVVGEDGQPRLCGMIYRSACALNDHKSKFHRGQQTCGVIVVGEDGRQQQCGRVCKNSNSLSYHKRRDHSGQKTCNVTVVREDGQHWPCRKVCKNAASLSAHKSKCHSGQRNCDVTMIGANGQQRRCGRVFKNVHALSNHKIRVHTDKQACDVTVIGEDGLQRPCGRICKNAKSMSEHKRKHRKRKPADLDQEDDLSP